MKERKAVILHGKITRGKHKIVVCFETKRGYRTPPKRRVTQCHSKRNSHSSTR
jgi:hypothetical protein